jgi:DNA-binding response OmpR family regulator
MKITLGNYIFTKQNCPRLRGESAITANLASFLERSSFEIKTAAHREEALVNIKIEAPGLIVSDVQIPYVDGCKLLHSRRRKDNWTS